MPWLWYALAQSLCLKLFRNEFRFVALVFCLWYFWANSYLSAIYFPVESFRTQPVWCCIVLNSDLGYFCDIIKVIIFEHHLDVRFSNFFTTYLLKNGYMFNIRSVLSRIGSDFRWYFLLLYCASEAIYSKVLVVLIPARPNNLLLCFHMNTVRLIRYLQKGKYFWICVICFMC